MIWFSNLVLNVNDFCLAVASILGSELTADQLLVNETSSPSSETNFISKFSLLYLSTILTLEESYLEYFSRIYFEKEPPFKLERVVVYSPFLTTNSRDGTVGERADSRFCIIGSL